MNASTFLASRSVDPHRKRRRLSTPCDEDESSVPRCPAPLSTPNASADALAAIALQSSRGDRALAAHHSARVSADAVMYVTWNLDTNFSDDVAARDRTPARRRCLESVQGVSLWHGAAFLPVWFSRDGVGAPEASYLAATIKVLLSSGPFSRDTFESLVLNEIRRARSGSEVSRRDVALTARAVDFVAALADSGALSRSLCIEAVASTSRGCDALARAVAGEWARCDPGLRPACSAWYPRLPGAAARIVALEWMQPRPRSESSGGLPAKNGPSGAAEKAVMNACVLSACAALRIVQAVENVHALSARSDTARASIIREILAGRHPRVDADNGVERAFSEWSPPQPEVVCRGANRCGATTAAAEMAAAEAWAAEAAEALAEIISAVRKKKGEGNEKDGREEEVVVDEEEDTGRKPRRVGGDDPSPSSPSEDAALPLAWARGADAVEKALAEAGVRDGPDNVSVWAVWTLASLAAGAADVEALVTSMCNAAVTAVARGARRPRCACAALVLVGPARASPAVRRVAMEAATSGNAARFVRCLVASRSCLTRDAYADWLSDIAAEIVGDGASSARRGQMFLFATLSDMVPHETRAQLRVHLETLKEVIAPLPPSASYVAELLHDYQMLVKVRLRELGSEAEAAAGAGAGTPRRTRTPGTKARADARTVVWRILDAYSKTHAIPRFLQELRMFRLAWLQQTVIPELVEMDLVREWTSCPAAVRAGAGGSSEGEGGDPGAGEETMGDAVMRLAAARVGLVRELCVLGLSTRADLRVSARAAESAGVALSRGDLDLGTSSQQLSPGTPVTGGGGNSGPAGPLRYALGGTLHALMRQLVAHPTEERKAMERAAAVSAAFVEWSAARDPSREVPSSDRGAGGCGGDDCDDDAHALAWHLLVVMSRCLGVVPRMDAAWLSHLLRALTASPSLAQAARACVAVALCGPDACDRALGSDCAAAVLRVECAWRADEIAPAIAALLSDRGPGGTDVDDDDGGDDLGRDAIVDWVLSSPQFVPVVTAILHHLAGGRSGGGGGPGEGGGGPGEGTAKGSDDPSPSSRGPRGTNGAPPVPARILERIRHLVDADRAPASLAAHPTHGRARMHLDRLRATVDGSSTISAWVSSIPRASVARWVLLDIECRGCASSELFVGHDGSHGHDGGDGDLCTPARVPRGIGLCDDLLTRFEADVAPEDIAVSVLVAIAASAAADSARPARGAGAECGGAGGASLRARARQVSRSRRQHVRSEYASALRALSADLACSSRGVSVRDARASPLSLDGGVSRAREAVAALIAADDRGALNTAVYTEAVLAVHPAALWPAFSDGDSPRAAETVCAKIARADGAFAAHWGGSPANVPLPVAAHVALAGLEKIASAAIGGLGAAAIPAAPFALRVLVLHWEDLCFHRVALDSAFVTRASRVPVLADAVAQLWSGADGDAGGRESPHPTASTVDGVVDPALRAEDIALSCLDRSCAGTSLWIRNAESLPGAVHPRDAVRALRLFFLHGAADGTAAVNTVAAHAIRFFPSACIPNVSIERDDPGNKAVRALSSRGVRLQSY